MVQAETIDSADKAERYALIAAQMKALLEGETHVVANLSNAAALLFSALPNVNWAGFYLMYRGALLLGPFQGKAACVHIPLGRGVCGTAAESGRTQRVGDVHRFPGHIACDSDSASEIVVPLRFGGRVAGVLDIDSPSVSRFDETDEQELEKLAAFLQQSCDWSTWDFGAEEKEAL